MEKAVLQDSNEERNTNAMNVVASCNSVVESTTERMCKLNVCGLIGFACMLLGHLFFIFLPVFGFLFNVTSLILAIIGYYQEKNNTHIKYQCMGFVYTVIIIDVVEIILGIMSIAYVIFELHSITKYGVSSGLIGKFYEMVKFY